MLYLDLTLPSLGENLALDEALLDEAENAGNPRETLRIWESGSLGVVVGRSSRLDVEVRRDACRAAGVPVLRRVSGGASVVVGPGCLMYSLVLSYRLRPLFRSLDVAHAEVLGKIVAALRRHVPELAMQGTCDLAIGDKKVSGNAVRCKREHILYHGTLLYDFPLNAVGRLLAMPPRQPKYRQERPHDTFVANLPFDAAALRDTLRTAWQAYEPCVDWPRAETARLAAVKYKQPEWNEQL